MKKFLGLLLAGAMLASSFTGCSDKASSSDEKTLLIGGTGPLTGDYATYGISVQKGAQIAVDEINEKGGVNGYTVKLEVEDDQADPQQAVQHMQTYGQRYESFFSAPQLPAHASHL